MLRRTGARELTPGELGGLSEGLATALETAGVRPRLAPFPSWLAYVARLWRGALPIMVLGRTIYWPGAPDDISKGGQEQQMAVLQHELQHVLEFATGKLSVLGYALLPLNWVYAYRFTSSTRWADLGAEQRAQVVQDYWLAERGLLPGGPEAETFRSIIPWAV